MVSMVAEPAWRELCRFDDPVEARTVATCLAAMEFDVRLCTTRPMGSAAPAAHAILVSADDRDDLATVLEEIVLEQREFDRQLAERHAATRPARIIAVIGVTGLTELLLLLASSDW